MNSTDKAAFLDQMVDGIARDAVEQEVALYGLMVEVQCRNEARAYPCAGGCGYTTPGEPNDDPHLSTFADMIKRRMVEMAGGIVA